MPELREPNETPEQHARRSEYVYLSETRSVRASQRIYRYGSELTITPWCSMTCVCETCLDADTLFTWYSRYIPYRHELFRKDS